MSESEQIWLGNQALQHPSVSPEGDYVAIDGESFYRIRHFDRMADFFISLVSDANHWLFISTSGALTAGRTHSGNALFPYYTEDKIRDSADVTGHRAIFLVKEGQRTRYWEPFTPKFDGLYRLERNLYKNILGSALIFEEINRDLGLTYRYAWQTSHQFGFVKKSWLLNDNAAEVDIRLLDGIQNILPCGAEPGTQNELSCLLDAYKKNELDAASGVAVYSMSSRLTDKAEPSEALAATTVWSYGLGAPRYLLSARQLNDFRKGFPVAQESDVHGQRGAYFVTDHLQLSGGAQCHWGVVADVNQGPAAVADLIDRVVNGRCTEDAVNRDIDAGRARLRKMIGTADGFQASAEPLSAAHHTANVLFNIMRGGLFAANYSVSKLDFIGFCHGWNRYAASSVEQCIAHLPEQVDYAVLRDTIENAKQPLLLRLFLEYLPLTFSRRHGDPSRPWNHFSIDVLTADNEPRLAYAGNWRDIFQNWEALSTSVPGFIDNIICKFVSASTPDGYNPYRITREGIDWEKPEPENPWANIGYWGDHQIIYLLKLLELSRQHFPQALIKLMGCDAFAYANVPYKIKGFDELLADPYDTILFDFELDEVISRRVSEVGADGRLVWVGDSVYQVNLLEKLLVTVLSKLTNFVPGGGIWMNTQRPEWNDANNALVGTGISAVTLCYLHRFLVVLDQLLAEIDDDSLPISQEVLALFNDVATVFNSNSADLIHSNLSETRRFEVMEQLGRAGEVFRDRVYAAGFNGDRGMVPLSDVRRFVDTCRPIVAQSICENRREDGLFHAYNRLRIEEGRIGLIRLDEMLEGQVAVLSAGVLSATESLEVLTALRRSALYTERQHSYLLYPVKTLARFTDKNQLDATQIPAPLLAQLTQAGPDAVFDRDEQGRIYFSGHLTKAADVDDVLDKLIDEGLQITQSDRHHVQQLFIDTFRHDLFTGRSGGMYAYEGIGSIYWHMVSKLLLAVSEVVAAADKAGASEETLNGLRAMYEDVRKGIGFNKSPEVYGAFPTDPYSHTPASGGARQPGMTGQVKEEVLTRLAEVGLRVEAGHIVFDPVLLRTQEMLEERASLHYVDILGQPCTVSVDAGQLAYTFCQVPVVVQKGDQPSITVQSSDGREEILLTDRLPQSLSESIFMKRGEVAALQVVLTVTTSTSRG